MRLPKFIVSVALAGVAVGGWAAAPAAAAPLNGLGPFGPVTTLASTVPTSAVPLPGNGDVNPYGVAVVQQSVGRLVRGDILVSNFNNAANLQGTGTTIVEVSPGGSQHVFARVPAVPRWHGPHHRPGHPAPGIRRRRQPPHDQRHVRDRDRRCPHHP